MKKMSIASLLFAVLFASNSCKNHSSDPGVQNYEENKMSLEDQERSTPLKFLSTDGTYRGTVIGHKMVLDGTITNSATLATYKDVTLKVTFYSQTNTNIGTDNYVIYDFFPPNQTKTFNSKIQPPDGTSTLGWEIISATAQ